jgi:hypothetical protein
MGMTVGIEEPIAEILRRHEGRAGALLPILKLSASMDPNNPILPGLIASLEKTGNDKVILTSKGIERGSHARLEVQ